MASRIIRKWSSLGEALAAAQAPWPKGRKPAECDSRGRSYFYGETTSLAQACEVAAQGWHEVRPLIDATISEVRSTLRHTGALVPQFRWDVSGGEVAVPLYLAGEPEHLRDAFLVPSLGRTVRIAIQTSTSGGVDSSTILKRGAAVLALVEALQELRVGVEVWAINSISGWDGGVRLTEASMPFDTASIAFAIAHPAMQRRVFFALQEHEQDAARLGCVLGGGYGGDSRGFGYYNGTASKEFLTEMEFDVHVTSGSSGGLVGNMDTNPAEWVRRTLDGLGLVTQ